MPLYLGFTIVNKRLALRTHIYTYVYTMVCSLYRYVPLYLGFTIVNKRLTGLWTYPVIDDVERAFGFAGVVVFITLAIGAFAALGFAGVAVVAHAS